MKVLKKIVFDISVIILILSVIMLTGCGFLDLGDYTNEEDYCNSFGTVSMTGVNGVSNFNVKDDFYNKDVVENIKCTVPLDNYVMFSVPVKKATDLDEFIMYIMSDSDCNITVRLYSYVFEVPTYDAWDDGGKQELSDEDEKQELPIDFLAEINVGCSKNEWTSFHISEFTVDGEIVKTAKLQSEDTITLLFLNNTAWGKKLAMQKCRLCLTGMFVRCI